MGPFETIDLNAPGGIDDYAERLGPLYHEIAQSRTEPKAWPAELIAAATAERRSKLPAPQLSDRRDWRDHYLMKMAAFKKSMRKAKI